MVHIIRFGHSFARVNFSFKSILILCDAVVYKTDVNYYFISFLDDSCVSKKKNRKDYFFDKAKKRLSIVFSIVILLKRLLPKALLLQH